MFKFSKSSFLYAHRSYQLKGVDIDKLISYYWEKEGIKIIKNGNRSPELLTEKRKKKLMAVAPIIENLQNNQKKYATYFQLNFLPPGETKQDRLCISNISPPFWKEYPAITHSIKKFILPTGHLKHLSNEDITRLNEIGEQHYKALLDTQIKYNIQALRDVCLEKPELRQEIEKIRKALKADEQIGYIFTNNTEKTKEHIECLILTQQALIKPITWNYFVNSGISYKSQLLESDFLGIPLYMPDLSPFNNKNNPIKRLPHAQADQTSCGTLCFSFLKKLLKNNGLEWKTLTLYFAYYDHHGEKKYFFLPSPSLLLYSQSSKYIDFLQKIMEESKQTFYKENKDQEAKPIWTLQGLLDHSIARAIEVKDDDMIKQNLAMLNRLPTFRPRWLEASQQAIEERKKMDDPSSNKNLYLMYSTKKLENISYSPCFFHHKTKSSNEISENLPVVEHRFNYK